jgi:hypothetical protein
MPPRRKVQLNEALSAAVREFGSPTTPRQLESSGVQNLRHLSLAQVSEMIEKAVNRTIMERTIGGMSADLGLLAERAQEGLLGLLKGVEEVEASRDVIQQSRREVLGELAGIQRDRARQLQIPPADPNDPTVQKMIDTVREVFAKLGPRTPESMRVEKELMERSTILLEEMRRRSAAHQIRQRDDHVDKLERRVAKLVQSLEATEQALQRVAAMKNIDTGIASLYRAVQGLSVDESNRALKKEMMEMIFKANIALQKKSPGTE